MIRDVKPQDATAITKIYNEYITNSIISFETEPLTEEDMLSRIVQISSKYPYLVYETGGIVVGYCYAHAWKKELLTDIQQKQPFIYLPHTQAEA